MPLSVVDIYKNLLPKTNSGDCGFPTCLKLVKPSGVSRSTIGIPAPMLP